MVITPIKKKKLKQHVLLHNVPFYFHVTDSILKIDVICGNKDIRLHIIFLSIFSLPRDWVYLYRLYTENSKEQHQTCMYHKSSDNQGKYCVKTAIFM